MIIPKADRRVIYENLFKGTLSLIHSSQLFRISANFHSFSILSPPPTLIYFVFYRPFSFPYPLDSTTFAQFSFRNVNPNFTQLHLSLFNRGCPRRQEGLQRSQAPRPRCQELVRHQGLPIVDLEGFPHHPLLVAVLLREPSPLSLSFLAVVLSLNENHLLFVLQYVLTPEGIDYLREYLHLPAEVRLPFPLSSPLLEPD